MQQCCKSSMETLYSDMDAILQRIKNSGFRLTRIRTAMVKILFDENRPLTSSAIQAQLSSLGIKANRTTVYRELLFLVGAQYRKNSAVCGS